MDAWDTDNCFGTAAMCHKDEVNSVAVSFRVEKESRSDGAQRGVWTLRTMFP